MSHIVHSDITYLLVMYFAIICLLLVSSIQAGPLPRLRYRPPKWAKLEPIKLIQHSEEAFQVARKFDTIPHLKEPSDMNSLFGKNDYIHLTKGRNIKHNNLLNIVEQLVIDEENGVYDQDDRDVMEVVMGLKRGLRRQGGLPPKLVYDFNELVAK